MVHQDLLVHLVNQVIQDPLVQSDLVVRLDMLDPLVQLDFPERTDLPDHQDTLVLQVKTDSMEPLVKTVTQEAPDQRD